MEQNQAFLAVPALLIFLLIGAASVFFSDKLLQQVEREQWAAARIVYAAK